MSRKIIYFLLLIIAAILIVAVVSWLLVLGWRNQPGGFLAALVAAALGTLGFIKILTEVIKTIKELTQPKLPPALFDIRNPPPKFTGRSDDLKRLSAILIHPSPSQDTGSVIIITGGPGVGKTALAYCIAQSVALHYPAARLERNLLGVAPASTTPLNPEGVMRSLIAPFYPDLPLPDDPDHLHTIYQQTFRRNRCLLLLDNAANESQVRPLLPPPPSAAIITSRTRLSLPPFDTNLLDLLSQNETRELLCNLSPRFKSALNADLDKLAGLSDRLPLAIEIIALLFQERTDWDFPTLLSRMDEQSRLVTLQHPTDSEKNLHSAFELSYLNLPDQAKDLFRALGVFPTFFDRQALAAIWENKPDLSSNCDASLGILLSRNLINYDQIRQVYDLHDLIRLYAYRLLSQMPDESHTFVIRHADHYLSLAAYNEAAFLKSGALSAKAIVDFSRVTWPNLLSAWTRLSGQQPGWPPIPSADRWLSEFPDRCANLLNLHLHPIQRIEVLITAVSCAHRMEDHQAEHSHLSNLGIAYGELGEPRKAIKYFQQSLEIIRQIGERYGEGICLCNLGGASLTLGNPRIAIDYLKQALEIYRQLGNRHGEGSTLGNLGLAHTELGELSTAIKYHEQSLSIFQEIDDLLAEGRELGDLGLVYRGLANKYHIQRDTAIDLHEKSLNIFREIGDRRDEGLALLNLGLNYSESGKLEKAIEYYQEALEILCEIGDHLSKASCLHNLGLVYTQRNNKESARSCLEQALIIREQLLPPDHPEIQKVRENLERLGLRNLSL